MSLLMRLLRLSHRNQWDPRSAPARTAVTTFTWGAEIYSVLCVLCKYMLENLPFVDILHFPLIHHTVVWRKREEEKVTLAALIATSKATDDYENAYTHFPSETDTWSPILKGGEAIQC